jgi:ACS family hexuronate transporter-like MFS transporter
VHTLSLPKSGNLRWGICGLLFVGTTINYVDRQVLGILAPQLQEEIGWSEADYGFIVTAFQAAYAIGFPVMGFLADRWGTRLGYAFALTLWSLAAMAHAAARNAFGFGLARFALGFGEAGNFPAAVKTTAEWFPRKERSFATGVFNSGTNIGAVVAPLVVPFLAIHYGWQAAFMVTGAVGLLWLIVWMKYYRRPRDHKSLTAGELAHIESGEAEPATKIPWLQLIRYRQVWAFALGKFMTDPVWWFFLFWLPKFLNSEHGLTLDKIGLPLIIIYLACDVGSILGGWLPTFLMKRGWTPNRSRKSAMLLAAISVTPIYFASQTSDLWTAVALIALATSSHQAWSANLYTLPSDLFPSNAVGSVVGFGSMMGALGGMFVATGAGLLLEFTGSYVPLFIIASVAYLLALGVVHSLAPRLAPLVLPEKPTQP